MVTELFGDLDCGWPKLAGACRADGVDPAIGAATSTDIVAFTVPSTAVIVAFPALRGDRVPSRDTLATDGALEFH